MGKRVKPAGWEPKGLRSPGVKGEGGRWGKLPGKSGRGVFGTGAGGRGLRRSRLPGLPNPARRGRGDRPGEREVGRGETRRDTPGREGGGGTAPGASRPLSPSPPAPCSPPRPRRQPPPAARLPAAEPPPAPSSSSSSSSGPRAPSIARYKAVCSRCSQGKVTERRGGLLVSGGGKKGKKKRINRDLFCAKRGNFVL